MKLQRAAEWQVKRSKLINKQTEQIMASIGHQRSYIDKGNLSRLDEGVYSNGLDIWQKSILGRKSKREQNLTSESWQLWQCSRQDRLLQNHCKGLCIYSEKNGKLPQCSKQISIRYVLQGNLCFYVENTISGKGKDLSLIQLQSNVMGTQASAEDKEQLIWAIIQQTL